MTNLRIEPARYRDGAYSVYEFGTYSRGSVLAGQTRKQFIDMFDDLAAAKAAYPTAEVSDFIRGAGNTFSHLPGEDDPVPGGMYPDDI